MPGNDGAAVEESGRGKKKTKVAMELGSDSWQEHIWRIHTPKILMQLHELLNQNFDRIRAKFIKIVGINRTLPTSPVSLG